MFSYPFASAAGVYILGETIGARSANGKAAYILSSFAGVPAAVGSGFLGLVVFDNNSDYDAFNLGLLYGTIPNAFFVAAVYNWLKKPVASESAAPAEVAPFVTAWRGAAKPLLVYGVSLSF